MADASRSHQAEQAATRALAPGEILFHQGDPPGPMYVIRSGSVRIYKELPGPEHRIVELARYGQGGHVGEMAPLLGEPRSATVQAVMATELVEVAPAQMKALMRTNRSFARAITRSLMERAGLSAPEAAAFAVDPDRRTGAAAPPPGAEPEGREDGPLPVPAHDPAVLYPKEVTCAGCASVFSTLRVRPSKDTPYATATDFHEEYRGTRNPNDYAVWVCPVDLYAALPDDFADLTDSQREHVGPIVAGVVSMLWGGERPDFNVDRNLDLREKSLQLALALYVMRGATPQRLAAIQHRLAWCARERGDTTTELHWLREALASYRTTYTETELGSERSEIRLGYLCGELALRVGAADEAVNWFWQVTRHPKIKDYPVWERKARERWATAQEDAATRAAVVPA